MKAFSGVPAAVKPIVEAAHRTVKAVAPGADVIACGHDKPKAVSMMWKLVRYVGGDVVVTLGTFTKHSSLFFARGAELDDASGLLEGGGKKLRYITLRTPADAERAAVKDLLRQAFALLDA